MASQAATQTGLGEDVLKKLLPMAATMLMGSLAKQQGGQGAGPGAVPGAGLLGMLTPLLDANRDGSMVDDVLGQVGKMFNR